MAKNSLNIYDKVDDIDGVLVKRRFKASYLDAPVLESVVSFVAVARVAVAVSENLFGHSDKWTEHVEYLASRKIVPFQVRPVDVQMCAAGKPKAIREVMYELPSSTYFELN